jgi:thiamine kinase-like enzyme
LKLGSKEIFLNINQLVEKLGIGDLIGKPIVLNGGALHTMWKVTTTLGNYAIKHLNPYITTKIDFKENFEQSEKIAYAFSRSQIPAVNSLPFDGRNIIEHNQNFFIVYPFISGCILDETNLTSSHYQIIGHLYSLIHNTNIQIPGVDTADYDCFSNEHWAMLINRSKRVNLRELLPTICRWNELYQSTIPELNKELVITHRDMHSQNILWDHSNDPHIIDWESAGMMNPMLEIIGYGLEWSGIILHQKVNAERFKTLKEAYTKNLISEWKTSAEQGFIGWLGHCVLAWTEFNLCRMLGDTTTDQLEINKGSEIINNKMIPCLNYIEQNESYLLEMISLNR